ncbi:MAG: hypothetical protein H0T11_08790 [Chthoniobacterales bacterium]|nr:hypothetical protein [Chthoniobacterales bacterium]
MFERRLKLFLGILLCGALLLLLRAAQLQVFGVSHWREKAADSMKVPRQIETTRGRIIDRWDKVLAEDVPCNDARVDYRAIIDPPDEDWVFWRAVARLNRASSDEYRTAAADRRKQMREAEILNVKNGIAAMWAMLARESDRTNEEIEEVRRAIVNHVEMRRRVVWFARYNRAVSQHNERDPLPWYRNWLIDGSGDMPELDRFEDAVSEEKEAHTVLSDISDDTLMRLKKNQEHFPGLLLRPGVRRHYPYGEAACHVIGRLGRVMQQDIKADPNLGIDPLRQYQYNDEIGRGGIESLAEPTLRGSRGQVVQLVGANTEIDRIEAAAGKDVKISIDIELQKEVEAEFKHVSIKNFDGSGEEIEMHGAAVAIDVKSGGVLALASNPTFNLNQFNDLYGEMAEDDINQPLLNRATQMAFEPGSVVKPIVGLGAIADGLVGIHETIECTGHLIINGRKQPGGFRCWTASKFGALHPSLVAHHQIGGNNPHPTGFLNLADGLERSCNIYFETSAHRLGMDGMRKWLTSFGLGRRTGIGISEARGTIPDPTGLPGITILHNTWWGAIGQGQVLATPIQMATVAATLARGGIWERPRLLQDRSAKTSTQPTTPDSVDLQIPAEALALARKGMIDVVHSPSGTGTVAVRTDMKIAGKTGTATAVRFSVPERHDNGALIRDEKGVVKRIPFETTSHLNRQGPISWYRGFEKDGKTVNHAWFIGYAPAEKPVIAFAVMIEYGGSGGHAAASVANGLLDACARRGYFGQEIQRMQPADGATAPVARASE